MLDQRSGLALPDQGMGKVAIYHNCARGGPSFGRDRPAEPVEAAGECFRHRWVLDRFSRDMEDLPASTSEAAGRIRANSKDFCRWRTRHAFGNGAVAIRISIPR
jgi:hypothetical protein